MRNPEEIASFIFNSKSNNLWARECASKKNKKKKKLLWSVLLLCVLSKKMSKLYIGNLAAEANEAALRQLLQESGVGNVSSVLVKRGGYAFIDCPEQSTIERAIEKLNGTVYIAPSFIFYSLSSLYVCLSFDLG